MISIFAAQDVGHQRGADKALWNGVAWHLGLEDCFAAGSGQTWPAYLVHDVMAGLLKNDTLDHFLTRLTIFQLFHHIRLQHREAATAGFTRITGGDGLLVVREGLRLHGVRSGFVLIASLFWMARAWAARSAASAASISSLRRFCAAA